MQTDFDVLKALARNLFPARPQLSLEATYLTIAFESLAQPCHLVEPQINATNRKRGVKRAFRVGPWSAVRVFKSISLALNLHSRHVFFRRASSVTTPQTLASNFLIRSEPRIAERSTFLAASAVPTANSQYGDASSRHRARKQSSAFQEYNFRRGDGRYSSKIRL